MPDKILLVAPAWVGDMVMSHVLVQRLSLGNPGAVIHVLAPAATLPVAERMPQVSKLIESPFEHGQLKLGKRIGLAKILRSENYQQALVLPNSFKSALVPWLARIKKRSGWRGEFRYGLLNDLRRFDPAALPLMVERFSALADACGSDVKTTNLRPALSVDSINLEFLKAQWQLTTKLPVVALCPGAEYGPSKQWPAKQFAELANKCVVSGLQVWILGSRGDSAIAQTLVAQMSATARQGVLDLTGKTSLVDVIDLLSMADAAVSNDSGLMHVAGAVGTPVVSIYGSTTPGFTPPLGRDARILQTAISCRPCFERHCPLGHLQCLKDIGAGEVFAALESLLRAEH